MSDTASLTTADPASADAPGAGPSSADLTGLRAVARDEQAPQRDRRFHVGLVLAVVLHSLLFAGFYGSPPRHIGTPDGSKDAIDVAFVSEAELRSLASAPPAAPKAAPVPPTPTPQSPEIAPAPEPASETSPPAPQNAPSTAPPQPPPSVESAVPDEALSLKPIEELRASAERKSEPQPTEPPKAPPAKQAQPERPERKRSAALDLSPPMNFQTFGGRGAGIARPAGITRSGENDMFARGVISALRRTMPQLIDTRGRVTVRITLDKDGDLVSTQVINPSNIADLDRSVVFATRQTSYPFPPRNARSADLVFLITYIYQ